MCAAACASFLHYLLQYLQAQCGILCLNVLADKLRSNPCEWLCCIKCMKWECLLQAGLGPAAAAIFLQPGEFGENLETSTLQNPVTDVTEAPEAFTAQYLSEVNKFVTDVLPCCG